MYSVYHMMMAQKSLVRWSIPLVAVASRCSAYTSHHPQAVNKIEYT